MNIRKVPLYYAAFVFALFFFGFVCASFQKPHAYGQPTDPAADLGYFLIMMGILFGYILPSVIAVCRSNPNSIPIVILNLALGWTFLGWLASLMWSFSATSTASR